MSSPSRVDRQHFLTTAALTGALLLASAAPADDTALFSAKIPPNVLLFFDESGSMRNIVQHPYFDGSNAPFVMSDGTTTCEVMTLADSATNTFPDETTPTPLTIKLVTGGSTGHRFEPRRSELLDWTATASALDDPAQGYVERRYCGNLRKIYTDVFLDGYTRTLWPKAYLDWYFHLETSRVYDDPDPTSTATKTGAEILAEIEDATNGRNYITGDYYPQYQLSRMAAAKLVAKEVMYRTNSQCPPYLGDCLTYEDNVRFGIAVFRSGNHGGFTSAAPADYTTDKATLETAIDNLVTGGSTPLGETLFQLYTYFMKRGTAAADIADRPVGQDSTAFPNYEFKFDGTHSSTASEWAPDPIAYDCQKQFIILVTDGAPTDDLFELNSPVTLGFSTFRAMIGDYGPDLPSEDDWDQTAPTWSISDPSKEEGSAVWPKSDSAGYLDDIALFIQEHDLRGDIAGTQTIDIYTVGFTTIGPVNTMLYKTARNGNGKFLSAGQADVLAQALIDALSDIDSKVSAFAAATVPASRTSTDNQLYYSYFIPGENHDFWEGHLKDFEFSVGGDILEPGGNCAVGTDPTAVAPCPTRGQIRETATGHWDAATVVPAEGSRNLYVGEGSVTPFTRATDWNTTTMDAADLNVVAGDLLDIPYTAATGTEDLADKLVMAFRGCEFGTSCTERTNDLGVRSVIGDVFHSNPLAIGNPKSAINESTYRTFATTYRGRDRILYAGFNDGFLHGFHAGDWHIWVNDDGVTPLIPPRYDEGTGIEEFGFMPSEIRRTLKSMLAEGEDPNDAGPDHLTVDGSPVAADVWMYRDFSSGAALLPTATPETKVADQWRTVLMGGLREGGRSYYALDVTNPAAATYPGYLWEFPCDAADCASAMNSGVESWEPWMGQTWAEPVITKVRVKSDSGTDPRGYERWVAIFGAGYDPDGDPNHAEYDWDDTTASKRGRAIFMVDITTGKVLAVKHFNDTVLNVGSTQRGYPEMRYAIASAPAVFDLDFDGYADVIYIGDLGGNLWKWVVRSIGDDPVNNTTADMNEAQPNWPFRLVFRGSASTEPPAHHGATPSDPSGTHFQSFFFPPTGVLRKGTLVIAFGAGERASAESFENDGLDTNNNHFYVLRDADPYEGVAIPPDPLTGFMSESDLATNAELDSLDCNTLHATKDGYVITARDAEKFVTNSIIFLGELITGSFIPPDPGIADPCTASGSAFIYRFDVDCGGGAYPSNPGSGNEDRRRALGSGMPTRPRVSVGSFNQGGGGGGCENRVVMITSDGAIDNDCAGSPPSSGTSLRSWRSR